MKSFVILLMFVGMAMVMHGIYEEKYKQLQKGARVEYRFVPRTFFDEQMADADVAGKFSHMFQGPF